MNSLIMTTERLNLRNWIDSDIKAFAEMNRDPEVMKYFPKTYSEEETLAMVHRIRLHFDKNGFGLYAVENKMTGDFIGFTGFSIPTFESFFTPCVEIGWRFKKDVWGSGYATEAAKACLKYGFETFGFTKIVSFTSSLNVNSEKLMRRIGMNYVAEFDHPLIDKGTSLCLHVLYQINR